MEEKQAEKSKEKINVTRLLVTIAIVLVTALVVGGVTWYYMDKSAKDLKEANDNEVQALEKQITILKKAKITETSNNTTTNKTNGDTAIDSASNTKNGVTLEITPTKGTVGTVVSVKITGLNSYSYTNLFFRSAGGHFPSDNLAITNTSGSFSGTYTIPSNVLTSSSPNAQNPTVSTPTDKGAGKIVLTDAISPDQEITIPFTVN